MLFRMHKTTGEVWDPWKLVILILMSLFWMKNYRRGLGSIETGNSDSNHFVLHAQNDRWGRGPVENSNSGPNVAVLDEKLQKRAGIHRDL